MRHSQAPPAGPSAAAPAPRRLRPAPGHAKAESSHRQPALPNRHLLNRLERPRWAPGKYPHPSGAGPWWSAASSQASLDSPRVGPGSRMLHGRAGAFRQPRPVRGLCWPEQQQQRCREKKEKNQNVIRDGNECRSVRRVK